MMTQIETGWQRDKVVLDVGSLFAFLPEAGTQQRPESVTAPVVTIQLKEVLALVFLRALDFSGTR